MYYMLLLFIMYLKVGLFYNYLNCDLTPRIHNFVSLHGKISSTETTASLVNRIQIEPMVS